MCKINYNNDYFNQEFNRIGSLSTKWDQPYKEYNRDILPMWVADMDFVLPKGLGEALATRAKHLSYGYSIVGEEDKAAFIDYMQNMHNLNISSSSMLMLPCVVTGLKLAVRSFTKQNEGVIIQTPVYGQFALSVDINDRFIVENTLKPDQNNKYFMDLDLLESQLKSGNRLILFCNPHNPVSRAWKYEELKELLLLAKKYNAILVSDEIHCDFVYKPNKFISMLTVAKDIDYNNLICLFSTGKTFNVAGLQQAQLVCENKDLLTLIKKEYTASGITSGNIFASVANKYLYSHSRDWILGLNEFLSSTSKLLIDLINKNLPRVKISPIEATYLAWLDFRDYGFSSEELDKLFLDNNLKLTVGTYFSKTLGDGFMRLNFATNEKNIKDAISIIKSSLEK